MIYYTIIIICLIIIKFIFMINKICNENFCYRCGKEIDKGGYKATNKKRICQECMDELIKYFPSIEVNKK